MNSFQTKGVIKAICFLSLLYFNCTAQQKKSLDKYFTAGYNIGFLGVAPAQVHSSDGGIVFKRNPQFPYSDNGRGGRSLTGMWSVGGNLGFLWKYKNSKSMTAINFSLQQNVNSYSYDLPFKKKMPIYSGDGDADDPPTGDSTSKSTGSWIENMSYIYYSASIQQFFYARENSLFLGGDKYRYIKLSYGQTCFYRNNGNMASVGNADRGVDEKNNLTTGSIVAINKNTNMFGAEIGIRSFSDTKKRSMDVGIACYIPVNPMMTKQFDFYERKSVAGTGSMPAKYVLNHSGTENITMSGVSVMLNMTYNFNSHSTPKHIDTTFIFPKIEESPRQPIVLIHKPHELNGRKVKVLEKINVNDTIISAEVWDKGKIDGDRISLYLNGVDILDDYTVGKTKKEIVLHLVPGKNYLVMHALNLGRIPPNTAALEISDGGKPNLIILNSDLKKSGAIEIDYNPI